MAEAVGIPGSISDEAKRIKWMRGKDLLLPTGEARSYVADLPDGMLLAVVAQEEVKLGKKLWHISVSHRDNSGSPDRVPSYDECKTAIYRLVQADVCMVLIFPRRSAKFVDIASTCLHFWESTEEDLDR